MFKISLLNLVPLIEKAVNCIRKYSLKVCCRNFVAKKLYAATKWKGPTVEHFDHLGMKICKLYSLKVSELMFFGIIKCLCSFGLFLWMDKLFCFNHMQVIFVA